MKLSIIIPVYNEEKTLKKLLYKVKRVKLPDSFSKEIIVVDDGSSDSSPRILRTIQGINFIPHKINRGKGAAIRTGLQNCKGEVIIIQDADLEYNPEDYPSLLRPILSGRSKVVYGTRLKTLPLVLLGKDKTPFVSHYLGNRFLSFITNILYGAKLTDMETCYKVFKKEIVQKIKLVSNRFEIEAEITAKILRQGYSIVEVPIKTNPRGYDEGKKITWRDGVQALWLVLKYRFQ